MSVASKRLKLIELKLSQEESLHQQYHEFLREHEELGHMSEVDTSLNYQNEMYNYLTCPAVFKDNCTTTHSWVVFDASSKTSSGFSLNDVWNIAPTKQDDLFGLITRMLTYNVVLTKMYR